MAERTSAPVRDVLDAAEALLDAHAWSDYGPIGLQVTGRATDVTRIVTSVSSTLEVFEHAGRTGAELVLCHHGLFWKGTPQVIDTVMRERLHALFTHGATLAAYHLPLDGHPGIGNNALLADGLGLRREPTEFASHGGRPIGIVGALPDDGLTLDAFTDAVRDLTEGRPPLILGARPERVRRVAVCSGGAAADIVEAAALGCDVFVTGEPREDSHALGRELGITLVAAGHHATERFGIRALGEHLAAKFSLEHEFHDADNPV